MQYILFDLDSQIYLSVVWQSITSITPDNPNWSTPAFWISSLSKSCSAFFNFKSVYFAVTGVYCLCHMICISSCARDVHLVARSTVSYIRRWLHKSSLCTDGHSSELGWKTNCLHFLDRMASTIIQIYLRQVLEAYFHGNHQVRQCASDVVVLVLKQGLIHPLQVCLASLLPFSGSFCAWSTDWCSYPWSRKYCIVTRVHLPKGNTRENHLVFHYILVSCEVSD